MYSVNNFCSIPVFPLGPTEDTCNQALGLESGAITDGRITASSSLNELRSPRYARLHQRDGKEPQLIHVHVLAW